MDKKPIKGIWICIKFQSQVRLVGFFCFWYQFFICSPSPGMEKQYQFKNDLLYDPYIERMNVDFR